VARPFPFGWPSYPGTDSHRPSNSKAAEVQRPGTGTSPPCLMACRQVSKLKCGPPSSAFGGGTIFQLLSSSRCPSRTSTLAHHAATAGLGPFKFDRSRRGSHIGHVKGYGRPTATPFIKPLKAALFVLSVQLRVSSNETISDSNNVQFAIERDCTLRLYLVCSCSGGCYKMSFITLHPPINLPMVEKLTKTALAEIFRCGGGRYLWHGSGSYEDRVDLLA
jgi:hypothetical protein